MRSTGPLAAIASTTLVFTPAGCTGGSSDAASDASTTDGELTHDDLYKELTSGVVAGSEDEGAEPTQEFVQPDAAEVAEFRHQEVEVDLVDLGCREKTDDDESTFTIQLDMETQFIADDKALLDALKVTLEQGG